ncbi:MAG: MetS family NSS transporter small subunit [Bacillota bacterium]|nr:MetS family NSS transporter small subunit [Bacillota bacterium]
MGASAIIMMCIACIGLWGGCALACAISYKHTKRQKAEAKEKE